MRIASGNLFSVFKSLGNEFVDLLGVGGTAGLLHNLTHEKAQKLGFTGKKLLNLLGIVGDYLIDNGFESSSVRNLPQAFGVDKIVN